MCLLASHSKSHYPLCYCAGLFSTCESSLPTHDLAVVANKMDLPNALSLAEIQELLQPDLFPRGTSWALFGASMISGTGMHEALTWLTDAIRATTAGKPVEV